MLLNHKTCLNCVGFSPHFFFLFWACSSNSFSLVFVCKLAHRGVPTDLTILPTKTIPVKLKKKKSLQTRDVSTPEIL